jgi:hypothetical protein
MSIALSIAPEYNFSRLARRFIVTGWWMAGMVFIRVQEGTGRDGEEWKRN